MSRRLKQSYEFGPFVLDPAERTLLRGRDLVPLQPKVFDTLLVLVQNGGHLVGKDEFIRAVWPEEEFVEEGNLNKAISKLRQALGESMGGAKYIETVPKSGYRFAADVRVVGDTGAGEVVFEEEANDEPATVDFEARADEAPTETAAETGAASALNAGETWRRPKRRAVVVAVVLAVALAAVTYFLYSRDGGEAITSVAVLPFTNDSDNPDVEYLSDGVSESLINSLSQLPELKVIARSSSFKYRGQEINAREAARALGVQAIVNGRVARLGDELRVSVELVDARDNTQLWGEQYKRKASDLLAVQSDISREIADGLRLRLTSGERQQLIRRETANPQAHELLLRARYLSNAGTTEKRMKAVEYLRQAIEKDPAYAPAYAELSRAYASLINNLLLDQKEYLPKVEEAARKALELDADLPEGHLAMAWLKTGTWKWADAEREYRRVIELNPNLASAHVSYTYHLIRQGRNEEALVEARRAVALDPLSADTNQAVVQGLVLAGQNDEAIETVKKMLELDSDNPNVIWLVGNVYERAGRYAEATAAYQKAIRLGDMSPDLQVALASVYAKAGQKEQARALLKRLETEKDFTGPVSLAIIYAELGEREQALAWLERACAIRDQQLIWVGVERRFAFASLQSERRFNHIMRCVGLAQ